jgi:hypothetical protein
MSVPLRGLRAQTPPLHFEGHQVFFRNSDRGFKNARHASYLAGLDPEIYIALLAFFAILEPHKLLFTSTRNPAEHCFCYGRYP